MRKCKAVFCAVLSCLVALGAQAEDAPVIPDSRAAIIDPDLPLNDFARDDLDSYGGWTKIKGQKTGFFHIEKTSERWWLITPEGNAYFALQVGWTDRKNSDRLRYWGFNCSEDNTGMPYAKDVRVFRLDTPDLPIEVSGGYPPWLTFPDVFDPVWVEKCRERVRSQLEPSVNDPLMVGYFIENEVCIWGWYDAVTKTAKSAPARKAFVETARKYYESRPDDLQKDWQDYGVKSVDDIMNVEGAPPGVPKLALAWESAMAEQAFGVASRAAREIDPNHLNFGIRMANAPLPSLGILEAMGRHFDVISLNMYSIMPDHLMTQIFTMVPAIHYITGRPTFISEFSYRGGDAGYPNTMGAMPTVKTQAERAVGYLSYVSAFASLPFHIGVSWYKYIDDAAVASWDGYAEDCNFGILDKAERPYAVLSQGMRTVNSMIYELASSPTLNESCSLFWRTELARWDVPGDSVFFQRMMGSSEPFFDPLANALPEPRRYHPNYWIKHRSPRLVVNDDRFVGFCQANVTQDTPEGRTLALFNTQAYVSFPRRLWYGDKCKDPDGFLSFESNAQLLIRKMDTEGCLRTLTVVDGSFIRTDFGTIELRTERRTPYVSIQYNYDTKALAITVRGDTKTLGLPMNEVWNATWNGTSVTGQIQGDRVVFFAPGAENESRK